MSVTGTSFRFRIDDCELFEMAVKGQKTVETRAAKPKYTRIKPGDTITLICGTNKFSFLVKRTTKFKTIKAMLQAYSVKQINPLLNSSKDLENMYYSYPNYKTIIKKYGMVAFEIKGKPDKKTRSINRKNF